MADDVVITGMGIVSSIGCDERQFWDSLTKGRSGASPVDVLDTSSLSRRIACQIREPINVGRPMGRAAALAVTSARQAIQSANLNKDQLKHANVPVLVGTTMGETEFIENRLIVEADQWLDRDHVRDIIGGRPGSIAGNVRSDLGITGFATDLYGACAAGNMAIESARRGLLDGRYDMAIAGGADGFSRLAFIGFMRLRVMAADVCRPFDQTRDGLLVGEGAVTFVLEREASARGRGAHVLARVVGGAITCENYHPTRPHPDGDGLTRATRGALADAGLTASDIDYVCAHGTGTPQNDAIEAKVMQNCFPSGVPFSSIKALTGHPMGAAAATEAAACVLSLKHQTLIPTWHLENVLEPSGGEAVKGSVRPTRLRYVLNNSAGFGGYNSSIVLAAA